MRLIKGAEQRDAGGDFAGDLHIDQSACYDFVVSLRALFNPRTYTRSRR